MRGRAALSTDTLPNLLALALGGYLAFHLWQVAGALEGLETWWQRVELTRARPWLATLAGVSVAGLVLGRLGLDLRAARAAGRPRDVVVVRVVSSMLVLGFLAFHLWHVRWPPLSAALTPRQVFDVLWQEAGRFPVFVAYVAGVTVTCAEVASRSRVALRISPWRALAWLGVAGLWVGWLHVFGYFANGEGLWR